MIAGITVTARTTTSATFDTKQRLRHAVEELIDWHARRTERLLVAARIALLVFSTIDLSVGALRWETGALPYVFAAHSIGLVWVLGILWATYRLKRTVAILRASVLGDTALVFFLFLPNILFPEGTYAGALRMVELGIIPLAIVASGFRLRRDLAALGGAASILACAILVSLDLRLNPDLVAYGVPDALGLGLILIGAAMLSFVVAVRTRHMVYEAARLATRADRARDRLRVYVSDEVAREALDGSDDALSLDGEQRHVAVLFSDLRGFTAYSNTVDPKLLVAELNAYFDAMVPVIKAQGGEIDKFIGDAIMAVFTREPDAADVSARALAAAFDMRDALQRHNEDRVATGRPPMRHGIGIHSGFVVAGNVGTQDKIQHTIIGDVVNVASRLEKGTKEMGVSLLCSTAVVEDARRAAGRTGGMPPVVSLGNLDLRGVDGPFEVYGPADEVTAQPAARR